MEGTIEPAGKDYARIVMTFCSLEALQLIGNKQINKYIINMKINGRY